MRTPRLNACSTKVLTSQMTKMPIKVVTTHTVIRLRTQAALLPRMLHPVVPYRNNRNTRRNRQVRRKRSSFCRSIYARSYASAFNENCRRHPRRYVRSRPQKNSRADHERHRQKRHHGPKRADHWISVVLSAIARGPFHRKNTTTIPRTRSNAGYRRQTNSPTLAGSSEAVEATTGRVVVSSE